MAQKRKRKNRKKYIYWILIIVLLLVAALICYLVWNTYFNGEEKGGEPESSEIEEKKNNDSGVDKNKNTMNLDDEEEEVEIVEKEKVVQYEGDNPNKSNDLSGVITYAGVNNNSLMIRVNIDQYLGSGDCKLSLVRNGSTIYNSTAGIVNSASTATCEGFDVPVSAIGGGSTEIIVDLDSDGRSGSIVGEVNI